MTPEAEGLSAVLAAMVLRRRVSATRQAELHTALLNNWRIPETKKFF
jgi:hypothetical protein